jgi:excisionase family DNA binding protein
VSPSNLTAPGIEPPLTPAEIAELTGLGYQSVLAEIHAGQLAAKRIRGKYLITRAAYDQWLAPDPPVPPRARPAPATTRRRAGRGGSVAELKAMTSRAKEETTAC